MYEYLEAVTVVEGVLVEQETFTDYLLFEKWLQDVEKNAEDSGYRTEVFTLVHPHHPCVECECAQYVTDHHPQYVFGGVNNV